MLPGVVAYPPEVVESYRQAGYWTDEPIWDVLRCVVRQAPGKVALISNGEFITYAQLAEQAEAVAAGLYAFGMRPLDRILVMLPNSTAFVILYLACQQLGVVTVMGLPNHRLREIRALAEASGAAACAVAPSYRGYDVADAVRQVKADVPSLRWTIVPGSSSSDTIGMDQLMSEGGAGLDSDLITIDPLDPAVLQLSGGTTGAPKLIPKTHNDYVYLSRVSSVMNDVNAESRLLNVLPMGHNMPLVCGLQSFLVSAASVVISQTTEPAENLRLIEEHRVTHLNVVPALLIRWLNDGRFDKYDLSSVRRIHSGGQRLQPEARLRARQAFPQAFVAETFGMAEGLLMFVRPDDPPEVLLETEGRPVSPGDEVRLINEDGQVVQPGEVGELCCRGPYTIRGYFGAEHLNREAFTSDGFFRSGDLAVLHPSGNFIIQGRIKDVINRGGEKISAEEVENLILGHPSVQNVACVGLPDPVMGERMCACIVGRATSDTITQEELAAYLLSQGLSKFKLPERVEIMDSLPLSPIGKVSKKMLVAALTER